MATYYWVGGNGTWDNASTTNWAVLSGGSGGFGPPNNADTVFFDAGSGTSTVVTIAATAVSLNVNINKADINLSLSGSPTLCTNIGVFTLTTGAVTLNNNTLTVGLVASSNTNTRSIAFGTGQITLSGNAGVIWQFSTTTGLTCTGTPNVVSNYAGAVGTRTVVHGSTAGGTEANAVSFTASGGTDIITIAGFFRNFNLSGWNGTLSNNARTIYGNFLLRASTTITAGANATTFAATSGTQQITSAANTLDFPITKDSAGTVQLQDNLTMGVTRTFTLTAGTLDLSVGNRTLSTGLFSSTNSNVRSILFGTGQITLTSNAGTIWNNNTGTNFTYTGTSRIVCNYSGAVGTRTISTPRTSSGGSASNSLNFLITAGTDIVTFGSSNYLANTIDFTGFTGTYTPKGEIIYKDFILNTGMTVTPSATPLNFNGTSTQSIKSASVLIDVPITFDGVGGIFQLQDNMTVGSTRTVTLSNGTIDLTGNSGNWSLSTGIFSSNTTVTRAIIFGTGNITVTSNNATVFNMTAANNFTYTGTPTIVSNYSGAVGTRTLLFGNGSGATASNVVSINITNGTDTVAAITNFLNLNFTGFSGTFTNNAITLYGSLTASAGMTFTAGANAATFVSTSAGRTITSAGKTLDFPLTFNGIGGVWAFQDALTQGSTRAFTITNGTVQLKDGVTSTVGSFVANSTAVKFLQSTTPGSQATLSQASGTVNVADLTIRDINAVGGASWNAYTDFENTDAGNNDGWNFSLSPPYSTAELPVTLRPFTQPRRF